ncbi:MAG: hypothetical protein RIR26_2839, partial [Pseudomonadota bacterium]
MKTRHCFARSPRSLRSVLRVALCTASIATAHAAHAGSWGMLLGYNNPAGSRVGLNFLYQDAPWGFEFGFGG